MAATPLAPGTPRENLRTLRLLTISLMVGIIIFSVIVILINQVIGAIWKEAYAYYNICRLIAGLIGIACFITARQVYNKRVNIISEQNPLQEKLNQYRSALILFMAICEGASLFSITAFFVTGDYILLIVPAVMVWVMSTKLPSAQKVVQLLRLDWNEQQVLE